MKIDRVTITGADDSTNPLWMVEVTKAFPFVEWGILISQRKIGNARFPSRDWCERLVAISEQRQLPLSVHICGRLVRRVLEGDWDETLAMYAGLIAQSQRIQLNFHASRHCPSPSLAWSIGKLGLKQQFIFQVDGVNDHIVSGAYDDGMNAVPLYDLSGGNGIVPEEWPGKMAGIYSGYAGGIGANNVMTEVDRIAKVVQPDEKIWIDMETKVRTPDGSALCAAAVESVLRQVASSKYLSGSAARLEKPAQGLHCRDMGIRK
jgi:hypothetical protein